MDVKSVTLDRGQYTTCTVHLYGATITSWRIRNREQLFVSEKTAFDYKKSIYGGIMLAFPHPPTWAFGPHHGFTKNVIWTIEEGPHRWENNDVELILSVVDDDYTRSMWNYSFKITYHLLLTEWSLHTHITICNTDVNMPFQFSLISYNYLQVPDAHVYKIYGLYDTDYSDEVGEEETEHEEPRNVITFTKFIHEIYNDTKNEHVIANDKLGGVMKIHKQGFLDTIVWKPSHSDKHLKRSIDYASSEYYKMVCIACACISTPVVLLPGASYRAGQIIEALNVVRFRK